MKKYFKWIKKPKTSSFDICFILGTGWNALHETLPVLVWIKEHYSDVKILSIIGENNAREQSILNKTYYSMLLQYSDALIMQDWMQTKFYPFRRLHLSIHKKIFKKYMPSQMGELLNNIDIKNVIFGDPELPVFKYVFEKYPKKAGIMYYNTGEISFESMSEFPNDFGSNFANATSVYFAKDELFATHLRKKITDVNVVMSGSPKLDPWWIEKRKSLFVGNEKYINNDRQTLAIALPKLNDIRLSVYEEEQLLLFINKNKNFDYIVAFHPRDDKLQRRNFLNKLKVEYKVWDGDLMTLSEITDVLVYVGLSTGQADCVVTEKPFILFYDDSKEKNAFYHFRDGRYGDFFHMHDVVPHARTARELSEKVYACIDGNLWEKYKHRYKHYVPRLPSCKLIAEYILNDKMLVAHN